MGRTRGGCYSSSRSLRLLRMSRSGPKKPNYSGPSPDSQFSKSAFAEAERRIADAQSNSWSSLTLSIPGLVRLPSLPAGLKVRTIVLSGASITDISPLKKCSSLRTIDLSHSRVTDISPLTYFPDLTSLNLRGTPVTSLQSLSGLTKLQSLDISNTKVRDLQPLALLTGLIGGLSQRDGGLTFANCPLTNRALENLSLLKNPDRTVQTINYLRGQIGWPEIPKDMDVGTLLAAIHDDPLGAKAVIQGEHLALAPSGDDTDLSATKDPVTRQLHQELIRRTKPLVEVSHRIQNQTGWADLTVTVAAFGSLVESPLTDISARIAELWSVSAALGGFYYQDDAATNRTVSFVTPLEPDQRRVLNDVITIAGVFVRRFPTARALDDELRQFTADSGSINAARAFIGLTQRKNALLPEHATLVQGALASPSGGHQASKAQGRGIATTYNISLQMLRIAGIIVGVFGAAYSGEIGLEVAQGDVLGKKIVKAIVDGEAEFLEFLKDAPSDLQSALQEILKLLK